MKKHSLSLILIFALVLSLTGCYEWPGSIYNPDEDGLPLPEITGLSSTTLLGGIDQLTITGSGFGTERNEVIVYFKKGSTVGLAKTLSVSDNEVVVEVPPVYSDSLETWIDRRGCFEFAKDTTNLITIESGLNAVGVDTANGFNDPISVEAPASVAVGTDGSVVVDISGKAYSYIDASGVRDDSQEAISDKDLFSMKIKGSDLYYVVAYYFVKQNLVDGTIVKTDKPDDKNYYYDFDFAENGWVYLAGQDGILGTEFASIDDSEPTVIAAETDYKMNACAVYGNNLYAAAEYTGIDTLLIGTKQIWKYPINSNGSLGAKSVEIDWADQFAGSKISGIAFADDGKMLVSTETTTPVYVIEPAGFSYADGVVTLLYQLLLEEKIVSMSWDAGEYMGIVTSAGDPAVKNVYKLKMIMNPSPYYAP